MNTIANTFASKLVVSFVAIAMMLSVAAPAQAASDTDLQAQIDALMATINALQAQLGQAGGGSAMTTSAAVCPYAWTRSLSSGSKGADVMKLQQFLNADAGTMVAATGAGSAGNETEYYGPATAAAVSAFQVMYRDAILTPVSLVNPTGYFGPSTMTKANALCVSAPVVVDEEAGDDASDEDASEEDDTSTTLGNGEGDIVTLNETSADESTLREGETSGLMAFDFEVEGDVEVNRVDFYVANTAASSQSSDPEDYFAGASLWVDGDKVGEVDVSDWNEDAYTFDVVTNSGDEYRIRFSGLGLVFEDGDNPEFQIAFEANNVIDTGDQGEVWGIDMMTDSIRFVDGQGFSDTTGSAGIEDTFTIQAEEVADLDVTKSSDSRDGTTVEVDDNDNSGEIEIFTVDFEETEGIDVTIEDMTWTASTTLADVTTTIDEVILYVGGEEIGSETPTAAGVLAFENLGLDIDADETVAVTAKVVFKQTSDYTEGDMVFLTFNSIDDASDANGNNEADFASTPISDFSSDTFNLRSTGVSLAEKSESFNLKANSTSDATDDQGEFTYVFEITAFGDDFYFNKTAVRGSAATTSGAEYTLVQDGGGTTVTSGTSTDSLTSSADTVSGDYKVARGQTETFTLKVTYDPLTTGFYGIQLGGVNYTTSGGGSVFTAQAATPTDNFLSDESDI